MQKKALPRIANSFSQDELKVLAFMFENATMVEEYKAIVRNPAFKLLYAKIRRMKTTMEKREHVKEEAVAV